MTATDEARVVHPAGKTGTAAERMHGPIDALLGDSEQDYIVVPRVLAQSMPLWWQHVMARCLDELRRAYPHVEQADILHVEPRTLVAPADLSHAEQHAAGVTVDDSFGITCYLVDEQIVGSHDRVVQVPCPDPLPDWRSGFVQAWPVDGSSSG